MANQQLNWEAYEPIVLMHRPNVLMLLRTFGCVVADKTTRYNSRNVGTCFSNAFVVVLWWDKPETLIVLAFWTERLMKP